ncbi:Ger(x)C family spore germination protein [Cohnella sp.]|uniref:Ger(x)C family spore germination protein n=1 Tax=Cohnella sp. TaxID=1883426 RepID=UPI0035696CD2
MMMMSKALCLFLLLAIITSTGCERARIIDDIVILSSKGYDFKDGRLHGSAVFSTYVNKDEQDILIGKAETVHGLFIEYNDQTSSPIEWGKTMVIVIGQQFATKGLSDLISSLNSDQQLGSSIFLVVSNQEAEKIMQVEKTKPPFYLSHLIKQNMEHNNTPTTNLHSALYQYFGSGQDVYLPSIRINQRGAIELNGLAVFQKDRMKLHLNAAESLFLKLLKDDKKSGKFNFPFGEGERKVQLFGQALSGSTKMSVKNLKNSPQILFKLSLNCKITDVPLGINLNNKRDLQSIQQAMERYISEDTKKLLIKFQKSNVDPVGIGDFVRGRDRDWKEDEFDSIYPNLPLDVETVVKILQSGVGE